MVKNDVTDAERLQAMLMCETHKFSNTCDKDCDSCNLLYMQGTMKQYIGTLQHAIRALMNEITVKDIVANCDSTCYIRILDNEAKLICLMSASNINECEYLTRLPVKCINSTDHYSITLYVR